MASLTQDIFAWQLLPTETLHLELYNELYDHPIKETEWRYFLREYEPHHENRSDARYPSLFC